jgi:hypothetical protein
MAINFGKMIGDIERDVFRFVNDPLSIFEGAGLTQANKDRLAGIRNSMSPLQPPLPSRVTPAAGRVVTPGAAAPAAGGPVTININITVHPNGVVAGVGTADANVAQPQAVVVAPPPDMRQPPVPSIVQGQPVKTSPTATRNIAKPLSAATRTIVKKKPVRPGR